MTRAIRWLRRTAEEEGVEVLDVDQGVHYRALLRASDGRQARLTMSVSASDHRAQRAVRAQIRRFADGRAGENGVIR